MALKHIAMNVARTIKYAPVENSRMNGEIAMVIQKMIKTGFEKPELNQIKAGIKSGKL